MGLFSNEYITTVGTTLARVIKDDSLPNAMKASVLTALVKTEDVVEYIIDGMSNSISVHADRMYDYAARRYTYGLPSGEFTSVMEGGPEVTDILEGIYGGASLNYSYFGPPNRQHFAWEKLVSDHGYDSSNNRLNNLSATLNRDVYMWDFRILIPAATFASYPPGALKQWGTSPRAGFTPFRAANPYARSTPIYADPDAVTPHVLVIYQWAEPPGYDLEGEYHSAPYQRQEGFTLAMDNFNPSSNYFHSEFFSGSMRRYWDYEFGTGGYATLDNLFLAPPPENGTFFPFLYFRYDKINQATDTSTEAYHTSKKMAKFLGIDYAAVCDSIEENPDINDVEQAMLLLAVPVNTENAMERRYLFDFFSTQYFSGDNQFSEVVESNNFTTNEYIGIVNTSAMVIKDARFKMVMGNNGIVRSRVAGVIGALGSYTSFLDTTAVIQLYQGYDSVQQDTVTLERTIKLKVNVYRHQVNLGEFDEVRVVNFKTLYYVLEAYASTTDEANDILFVPLDRSITAHYSLQDKEELYARSLHFVFNSAIVTSVKWYQQMWFEFILIVVAAVITICTMGTDGGTLIAAVLAGSTAAITAATLALLQKILISLIMSYVMKLFVQAVGIKIALIVAILVVLAGGFMSMDAGSVAGAPWAQELISLGNGLAKAAQSEIQSLTGELMKEARDFNLLMDTKYKELEEAQKLLQHHSWLSPTIFFGESPEDFYNRTVHSGNIGLVSIGAISSYVDIALTLPKLDEQVGGNS